MDFAGGCGAMTGACANGLGGASRGAEARVNVAAGSAGVVGLGGAGPDVCPGARTMAREAGAV
jgi:hypothetical protein